MTDISGSQTQVMELDQAVEQKTPIKQQDVIDYLLDNPQFFSQNPSLLERLAIPHKHRGSVSLVELQGEQLRRKVRLLSRKLNQLINIAQQNEQIYRIYVDLNLKLLECEDMTDIQATLQAVMQEQLKLSAVTIKPFIGALALPEIQRRLFAEKRFKQGSFFFGRLSQHEKQLLFGKQSVESVALMLLGDEGELGILAIGSKDPSHFNPNMDTLLINQLQEFLNILLPRLMGVA